MTEAEMIKVENIKGSLFLIGARDDALWDTGKYIDRMEERLKSRPHECRVEIAVSPEILQKLDTAIQSSAQSRVL